VTPQFLDLQRFVTLRHSVTNLCSPLQDGGRGIETLNAHNGSRASPPTERRREALGERGWHESSDGLADGVDEQTGHSSDDRAVDADVLQVGSEQQLELIRGAPRIPLGDGARDERIDVVPENRDDLVRQYLDGLFDALTCVLLISHPRRRVLYSVREPPLECRAGSPRFFAEPAEAAFDERGEHVADTFVTHERRLH
jgi:hypothetical protein